MPQSELDGETVKKILVEYRIHNADVILKEDIIILILQPPDDTSHEYFNQLFPDHLFINGTLFILKTKNCQRIPPETSIMF